jgi:hypothetical protein
MKSAAALALAAALAVAGGARAEPTPAHAAASALPPGALDQALHIEMGLLRLRASVSFPAVWAAANPTLRRAAAVLEPRDALEGRLWTDFFAHAVEARMIVGDKAVSGWRDPLTDVWLLGDWSREGDGWRLDHLTLSLTQTLSGAFSPGAPLQPAFPGRHNGLGQAIAANQILALAAFRRAARTPGAINWNPNGASAWRAHDVALTRLSISEDSLAKVAHDAPGAGRIIRVALVEETPMIAGVSPSVAQELRRRSLETRLSLQPIKYLNGQSGEVLAVVQSMFEPEHVFVAHLASSGPGGGAKVANVEAIDLSKAEPAP